MLVFDIEIFKAVPSPQTKDLPKDIQFCEGWHDHANMGVSVVCAYDYREDRYRVFTRKNLVEFQALIDETVARKEWVGGFNSVAFDAEVLKHSGITIPLNRHYDLLREIWRAAGLVPFFASEAHKGFSLDLCAHANFDEAKSGNGAYAPVQWQRGEYGAVIDYCLQDVRLTKKLIDKVVFDGWLHDPRDPANKLMVLAPGLQPLYE